MSFATASIIFVAAINLSWTAPTEFVDGSPLPKCSDVAEGVPCLDKYRVYYGPDSRNYTDMIEVEDENQLALTFTPAPGDYFIAITAIDDENDESAYSNEVLKTEDGGTEPTDPLPPGGLAIVGDAAYIIVQSNDTLVLLPIGTINVSTPCSPDVIIRDDNGVTAYKVPVSSVTPYSSSQEMVVVFSTCTN
jgi:hypothetical protein